MYFLKLILTALVIACVCFAIRAAIVWATRATAAKIDSPQKVRCNMCMWEGLEEDLILSVKENGITEKCPQCGDSECLMDL